MLLRRARPKLLPPIMCVNAPSPPPPLTLPQLQFRAFLREVFHMDASAEDSARSVQLNEQVQALPALDAPDVRAARLTLRFAP